MNLLLHPLVGPHHVEDAGCEPQHEEQQKQPGLGAQPPVQAAADERRRRSPPRPARPPCACRRPCRARASRHRDRRCASACCCALTLPELARRGRKSGLRTQPRSSGVIWPWPEPRSSAGSDMTDVLGGRRPERSPTPRGPIERGRTIGTGSWGVKECRVQPSTLPHTADVPVAPPCDNWTARARARARRSILRRVDRQ